MRIVHLLLLELAFFWGAVFLSVPAAASSRVALIIANTHYRVARIVPNSISDGGLIAEALVGAEFAPDDITTIVNGDKARIETALRAFALKAREADVAVIYFAGHGIELRGLNFLIPVDAGVGDDRHIREESVPLNMVMQAPEGARLRIIILDACRDDPFSKKINPARPKGTGLSEVEPGSETLVAYSTRAGRVSRDDVTGWDWHSPFATSLAKRIREPGLEIGLLFRAVRDDVLLATGREQEPIAYGALSSQQFYFIPRRDSEPALVSTEVEVLTWQVALLTNTQDAFQGYLNRFPSGFYAAEAQRQVDIMSGRQPIRQAEARPQPEPVNRDMAEVKSPKNLKKLIAAYASEIGPRCNEALSDRFPLVPTAVADVADTDVYRLLGPNGMFDVFAKHLLPLLDTSAARWRWRPGKAVSAGLSDESAEMLGRAAILRDMLAENVAMTVSLERLGVSIDRVELVIGDQRMLFDQAHAGPYPIVWRFLEGIRTADIRLFKGDKQVSVVQAEGVWPFLRLMNQARRQQRDPQHFTVTFQSGIGPVELSFALPGKYNPFDPSFWSLRCASRL